MKENKRSDLLVESKLLMYLVTFTLSIGMYFLVDLLWNENNFITLFALESITIIAILALYRILYGPDFWKLLPTVTSAYIFLALFVPTIIIYKSELLRDILDWNDYLIIKASSLGIVFIQFLWAAYHVGTLIFPVRKMKTTIPLIPVGKIYLLIALTLVVNLIAVLSGTFGILQSTDLESTSKYSMYIDLGQQLGLFSLIILTYQYTHRKYLIGAIGLVLFVLGIVSAQKQAALMPLLAIAVTLFFKKGKFPKGSIFLALAGLVITFAAVTTIRQYYFTGHSKGVTSITEVQEISLNALNPKTFNKAYNTYNVNEHILIRLFYGNAISKAIAYCEKKSFGVPDDSRLYQVIFAPLYAVVPRIIWPDKPLADFGNWFASEIFVKHKVKYSIGITPVGYGYMLNGVFGVITVALILGLFMSLMYKLISPQYLFIYIFIFIKSLLPADVTWEYIAGNIKFVLVYWIIYEILQIRIFAKRNTKPYFV